MAPIPPIAKNNVFTISHIFVQISIQTSNFQKYIKSILDLNGITRKEFAYLLYVTHDLQISYNDAVLELSKTNDFDREIPLDVANKYNDVKFNVFLTELGITMLDENRKYHLANSICEKCLLISVSILQC